MLCCMHATVDYCRFACLVVGCTLGNLVEVVIDNGQLRSVTVRLIICRCNLECSELFLERLCLLMLLCPNVYIRAGMHMYAQVWTCM